MRNVFLSHYTVSQARFDIEKAKENCRRLMLHVIDVLLSLYSRYPGFNDFFPLQVEMRCYKLVNFLISYDIISLFTPERIKIDPYVYLLARGGGVFQTTCSPMGHLYFSEKVFRLTNILERTFNKQKCD